MQAIVRVIVMQAVLPSFGCGSDEPRPGPEPEPEPEPEVQKRWSDPIALEPEDADSNGLALAGNSNGQVVAAWIRKVGPRGSSAYHLWSSRFEPGRGWEPAADMGSGWVSRKFDLAIDSMGNAVAVWIEVGSWPSHDTVTASRWQPETGWSHPVRLDSDVGTRSARYPRVTIDGAGVATAVWEQEDDVPGYQRSVWAARHVPGNGWSAPRRLGEGAFPLVAASASGRVTVTSLVPLSGVAAWMFMVERGWDRQPTILDQQIGSITGCSDMGSLAMDESGNAIAVWHQDGWTIVNQYEPATGWHSTPTLFRGIIGGCSSSTFGNDGRGFVLWGDYSRILSVIARPGQELSREPDVVARGASGAARVVADPASEPVAVWVNTIVVSERGERRSSIWANRYEPRRGWGQPDLIAALGVEHVAYDFEVTTDASGNATAMWVDFDRYSTLRGRVWASRFE
jgi:hypothetical protein